MTALRRRAPQVRFFALATLALAIALAVARLSWADALRAAPQSGDTITNSIGVKLAFIPAGEFAMGSPPNEPGREHDEAQHPTRITRPIRMGITEITQAQWSAVMGKRKCAFDGDDRPVESISWKDAVAFCEKLSQMEGRNYRLPSEAEWEYACRAGAAGGFAGAGRAEEVAWFEGNSDDATHPVATRKANTWGLCDMQGNVAEWCADYYAPDYPKGMDVGGGPAEGKARVVRGGSYASFARGCRCAARSSAPESYSLKFIGLRVVLDLSTVPDLDVMDTWFWNTPEIPIAEQVAMLKRLGYSGMACSWGHQHAERMRALKEAGLRCSGVYTVISIDESGGSPSSAELAEQLKGSGALVWLTLTSNRLGKSDAGGDEDAAALIAKIADDLNAAGLPGIALYPHVGHWLERTDDAVRLAERLARPDVGVMFNQYHWMATDGGVDLRRALVAVRPYLRGVTINGSAKTASILPLGEGEFDTFTILRALAELGYGGSIASQGFGLTGRVPERLSATKIAWDSYLKRLID